MKIDTSIRTFLTGIGTSITSGLKGIKEGIHKIKHDEFSCKNILDNNGAIKGSMILFCSILRFVTKKFTPSTSISKKINKTSQQSGDVSKAQNSPETQIPPSLKGTAGEPNPLSTTTPTEKLVAQETSQIPAMKNQSAEQKALMEDLNSHKKPSISNESNFVESSSKSQEKRPLSPLPQNLKESVNVQRSTAQEETEIKKPTAHPSSTNKGNNEGVKGLIEKWENLAAMPQNGQPLNEKIQTSAKETATYAVAEPSMESTEIETKTTVESAAITETVTPEQKLINEGLESLKNKGVDEFIEWSKDITENKEALSKVIQEQIYLEGTASRNDNGISLSADDILNLGKDVDFIKKTPAYGLALLKDKKVDEFIEWSKDITENKEALSKAIQEQIYLEGTASRNDNGISLSADDILNLGKEVDFIKKTPAYGLALFKLNKKQELKDWATTTQEDGRKVASNAFTALKERMYLEGTASRNDNGINLSADDILNLGKEVDFIKKTPAYGLALFKLGKAHDFKKWATTGKFFNRKDSNAFTALKERMYLEGMSHYSTDGICLSTDDIYNLGEIDKNIRETTAYKTAKILKENRISLDDLKTREYSEVSGPTNDRDICVPADVHAALYMQKNGLSLDVAKILVAKTNDNNTEKLGEGSFGCVYQVEYEGKVYAVKIVKAVSEDKKDTKLSFLKEKQALDHLHSHLTDEERKYFVDHFGAFEIDGQFVFISECITHTNEAGQQGSDLAFVVKEKDNYSINQRLDLTHSCFKRNAVGQKYGLLHRDEKPENIMVSGDGRKGGTLQAKGADYGTACLFWDMLEVKTKGIGTPSYMAPEILKKEDGEDGTINDKPCTYASCALKKDVYCMGLTLLEVLGGEVYPKSAFKFPWKIAEVVVDGHWDGEAGKTHIENHLRGLFNSNDELLIPKTNFLISLAADCLTSDRKQRISAEQAEFSMKKFIEANQSSNQTLELYDYEALKKDPNYPPKGIPEALVNMIKAGDYNAKKFFMDLITEDTSYLNTPSGKEALKNIGIEPFKDLNLSAVDLSKTQQDFLKDLLLDCFINYGPGTTNEQAKFLINKFNEFIQKPADEQTEELYNYENLCQEEDYPKAEELSVGLMNLIKAKDEKNGYECFEQIIKENPSFIEKDSVKEALKEIGLDRFKSWEKDKELKPIYKQIEKVMKKITTSKPARL